MWRPNSPAQEYKNAAPATAPSPYAVTTAAGQTEAPAKFVLKQRRDKNWNEELQELVDAPDSAAKYHQLSALIREFNFVAETFGKVRSDTTRCNTANPHAHPGLCAIDHHFGDVLSGGDALGEARVGRWPGGR